MFVFLFVLACKQDPTPVQAVGNELTFPVDGNGFLIVPPESPNVEDEIRRLVKEIEEIDKAKRAAEVAGSESPTGSASSSIPVQNIDVNIDPTKIVPKESVAPQNITAEKNNINESEDPSKIPYMDLFKVEYYTPRKKPPQAFNPYRLDDSQVHDPNNPNPYGNPELEGYEYERDNPPVEVEYYMGEGE